MQGRSFGCDFGRNLILVVTLLVAGTTGFLDSKLVAQPLTTPVNLIPDCMIFYDFAANASSASFDNRFTGCTTWYVAYTSTGFPALTLTLQDAPDASGVPGAWVAFAGVLVEGVNPNVALTQAATTMYGYYPWVRVTLTGSVAGAGRRLRGTMYGYRQTPVANIVFPPAAAVTANQGTPTTDANSWPVHLATRCTQSAAIELAPAAIGTQQIVALTAGQTIRVCGIVLANSAAADIRLVQGTGANCVAGPVNITGTLRNVLSWVDGWQSNPLTLASAQALCLNSSAAVNIGGLILYDKF
jgi:hypothetical protein